MLASIEQGAEGAHVLEEQIVATPWSDDHSLRDEALIEGAVAAEGNLVAGGVGEGQVKPRRSYAGEVGEHLLGLLVRAARRPARVSGSKFNGMLGLCP